MQLDMVLVERLARAALDEDLGEAGDITTACSVPPERQGEGRIIAKERGVLAGLPIAAMCFRLVDDRVKVSLVGVDGGQVSPGDTVLRARGPAPALLAAERTSLNFLQRLSGIATATRAFVDAVAGTGARVLDTRKTTPGLRALEKYAVRMGGGENHRFGLHDQVLLKENHFALALPATCEEIVRRCVARSDRPVIAEARTLAEALAAVRGGARVVMLDNFVPGPALREAVGAVRAAAAGRSAAVEIEVSGGVDLASIRAIAACGVDRISVGRLTHSPRALDLSMLTEFTPVGPEGR